MKRSLLALAAAAALARPAFAGPAPRVLVAPYSGIISPVAAEFMTGAVARAREEGDAALVIELDTPGGLDLSMREIIKALLADQVPVVVYVSPPGARAASAGVFITMAADVAAMAPGTNIGAAHPVSIPAMAGGGGDKTDKTMETKVASDAAAYLKSIAQKRGRNEAWAEAAVVKSTSIPAGEALKIGVVDLLAQDLPELLRKIDGRKLAGFKEPLHTAGAQVVRVEMTRRQRWLATLSDPNIAMILMSLGAAGIFIELYNPGLVLPGIVGALSLLLAFYSFQTLSASYAGVLLILVGLVCFLLEIKVASYGMLSLGGIAAFLLGVLLLFQNQALGGVSVSWGIVFSTLGGLLAVVAAVSALVLRAYRRPVSTGRESMLGQQGRALEDLSPEGKVSVGGEIWDARAESGTIPKGEKVVVCGQSGLHLTVRSHIP